MPIELDPRIAERLVCSAISCLQPPRGDKVLCTRRALKQAIHRTAQEAYEIGVLAGQKEQFREYNRPGDPNRPAWMDIRLDDPDALARRHVRFKPVTLKSLLDAGYRCLGDLRWVPNRELTELHYIGFKTARQILAVVRRFETAAESSADADGFRECEL